MSEDSDHWGPWKARQLRRQVDDDAEEPEPGDADCDHDMDSAKAAEAKDSKDSKDEEEDKKESKDDAEATSLAKEAEAAKEAAEPFDVDSDSDDAAAVPEASAEAVTEFAAEEANPLEYRDVEVHDDIVVTEAAVGDVQLQNFERAIREAIQREFGDAGHDIGRMVIIAVTLRPREV